MFESTIFSQATFSIQYWISVSLPNTPVNMPLLAGIGPGPMLPASDQYRPDTTTYRNVYRDKHMKSQMLLENIFFCISVQFHKCWANGII